MKLNHLTLFFLQRFNRFSFKYVLFNSAIVDLGIVFVDSGGQVQVFNVLLGSTLEAIRKVKQNTRKTAEH